MRKGARANLAELSAAVCCDFEDNPIALAMLGAKEVFLCAAPYGGTPL